MPSDKKVTLTIPESYINFIDSVGSEDSNFNDTNSGNGRQTRGTKLVSILDFAHSAKVQQKEREARSPSTPPTEAPTLTPARQRNRYLSDTEIANHATITQDALSRKHIADMETPALLNLLLSEHSIADIDDLKHLAGLPPQTIAKKFDVPIWTANRIALAIEFAKRLAYSEGKRHKITSPSDVADLLMSKMRYLTHEVVTVLTLDTKSGVTDALIISESEETASEALQGEYTGQRVIFEGTLNASVFHPREIFRYAIENAANSIVLAHNHPSGDPQPSQEDIRATKQLIEAGNQIGIKVLDHIIIGDGTFISLKEEGHI